MMAAERGIDPDLDLRINPLALVDLRDDFEAQGLIHVVHAPASFTHPHSLSELAACAPQVIIYCKMYLAQENVVQQMQQNCTTTVQSKQKNEPISGFNHYPTVFIN